MKVKLKMPLCLFNYETRHKDVWGNEGIDPQFFISVLVEMSGQLHALAAYTPGK
jgi:hypothetical protein